MGPPPSNRRSRSNEAATSGERPSSKRVCRRLSDYMPQQGRVERNSQVTSAALLEEGYHNRTLLIAGIPVGTARKALEEFIKESVYEKKDTSVTLVQCELLHAENTMATHVDAKVELASHSQAEASLKALNGITMFDKTNPLVVDWWKSNRRGSGARNEAEARVSSLPSSKWPAQHETVENPGRTVLIYGVPTKDQWPRGWNCGSVRYDLRSTILRALLSSFTTLTPGEIGMDDGFVLSKYSPMRAIYQFKDTSIADKCVALKSVSFLGKNLTIFPYLNPGSIPRPATTGILRSRSNSLTGANHSQNRVQFEAIGLNDGRDLTSLTDTTVDNSLNEITGRQWMRKSNASEDQSTVSTESGPPAKDTAKYTEEVEEASWRHESGLLNAELTKLKEQNDTLTALQRESNTKFAQRLAEVNKNAYDERRKLEVELSKKMDELAKARNETEEVKKEKKCAEKQFQEKMKAAAVANEKDLEKKLKETKKAEKERLQKLFQKKLDDAKKSNKEELSKHWETLVSKEKEKNNRLSASLNEKGRKTLGNVKEEPKKTPEEKTRELKELENKFKKLETEKKEKEAEIKSLREQLNRKPENASVGRTSRSSIDLDSSARIESLRRENNKLRTDKEDLQTRYEKQSATLNKATERLMDHEDNFDALGKKVAELEAELKTKRCHEIKNEPTDLLD